MRHVMRFISLICEFDRSTPSPLKAIRAENRYDLNDLKQFETFKSSKTIGTTETTTFGIEIIVETRTGDENYQNTWKQPKQVEKKLSKQIKTIRTPADDKDD